MQANSISTAALRLAPRLDVARNQAELLNRTKELATQRHADVGLALAEQAGRTVTARIDHSVVETLLIANQNAAARMDTIQESLSQLEQLASTTLGSLVALPAGSTSARAIEIEAQSALEGLVDVANGTTDGAYIFGGINTGEPPMERYATAFQAKVEAAFVTHFAVAVNDPAAASISATDLRDFIRNEFATLFSDDTEWADFSNASGTNVTSRIAPGERVVTSASTQERAFRDMARGLVMVAGLGITALSEEARAALIEEARSAVGMASSGMVELAATLAYSQQATERADHRLRLSRDFLAEKIGIYEGIDAAEAKTRVDLLTTRIEMSYALTAQLARLSILNYA